MERFSFIPKKLSRYVPNKQLIKQSLTYVGSDVLNKILPFLLLPIITRFLTPTDYGTLSIIDSIVAFLAVFVGLGSQEMVKVNYFKMSKDRLKYYIGSVFYITLITSAAYLVLFLIFNQVIYSEYGLSFLWMFIAVVLVFGEFFRKIISIIWISEGSSMAFAKYQNLNSLLIVLTTVLFVVVLEMNWQGRVYSLLLSGIVFSIMAFYFIYKKGFIAFKYNRKGLRACVKESSGALPYSVSFWFKNAALLLIMASLIGKDETGIYASAMRIAALITFATNSLNKVWLPLFFKLLADKSTGENRIVRSMYWYMLLIVMGGIGLYLFTGLLVRLMLAPSYHAATPFARLLVITITIQSLFTAMANYLLFYKEGKKLSFVSISGIVLQYLLIVLFFYLGYVQVTYIIYALLISSIYTLVVSWYLADKVRTLPWLYFLKKSTPKQINREDP